MNRRSALNIAKVAMTYAGTIVGAGFASGQELLQFFAIYGNLGLVGVLLAGILLAWLGWRVLELGHSLAADGYGQVLYKVCGRRVGRLLDIIVTVFLFCVLTIMIAGAGTVGHDNFGLPYIAGGLAMTAAVWFTGQRGLTGIVAANFLITPLLIVITLAVGIYSLDYHGLGQVLANIPPGPDASVPPWLLASLLYASYNLVMATTVLAPLGAATPDRTTRRWGSLAGGLTLTLLAACVTGVVLVHYPDITDYEIPMLYISGTQHVINHVAYLIIFICAMFTTALAGLYGCAVKLSNAAGLNLKTSITLLAGGGLLFSQFGFADLIAVLFPVFGYITLWFTIRLIFTKSPGRH